MRYVRREKGFSLVEVMLAFAIVGLILLSVTAYIPKLIQWEEQNNLRYQATNKIIDLEKRLLDRNIDPSFEQGWVWEQEEEPFQYSVSYLYPEQGHHVFEIKVRWGSGWRTQQEVSSKTLLTE